MNLFWLIPYARAVEYNLIQPLPGIQTVSSFPQYIESALPFILSLAAILAAVMIVVGGVEYAISLSEDGKKLAKSRINNAILGLLLALVSYLILYTINPDLTKLKLDIKELQSPGTTCTPPCDSGEVCVNNACVTQPSIPRFACSNNACVANPNGPYYISDCGGQCSPSTYKYDMVRLDWP